MAKTSSHGHFLLLLRVTGVDDGRIGKLIQEIHDAYMEEYGSIGAFTVALLKLGRVVAEGTNVKQGVTWSYAVRYFGPTVSVDWLQKQIESVATREKTEVETQTFTLTDITGRY